MRWQRRHEPATDTPHLDESGMDEAHQALEQALAKWPEVNAVTEQIRGIRRRNHLAEITERALRGSR